MTQAWCISEARLTREASKIRICPENGKLPPVTLGVAPNLITLLRENAVTARRREDEEG